jgi:hypothetical protein
LSHTDNTDPYWVRAQWWEPCHWRCQHSWVWRRAECDLPDEPIVSADFGARWRNHGHCSWVPADYGTRRDRFGRGGAPNWFNNIYFTRPERARVRDQLNRARAEYRAGGEVDVVPDTVQTRHRGRWLYW